MRILWISILSSVAPLLWGQAAADWPMYSRDLAGTRYSPLSSDRCSAMSRKLTQAWSRKLRGHPAMRSAEVTPIVIDGVMYLPASDRILALEADTGKEIWSYELPPGRRPSAELRGGPATGTIRPADLHYRHQHYVQPGRGKGSRRSRFTN